MSETSILVRTEKTFAAYLGHEPLGHLPPGQRPDSSASPGVLQFGKDYLEFGQGGHLPCNVVLWDRETFGDGADSPERSFFTNYNYDAQGRKKTKADSWMNDYYAFLPCGYDFLLYRAQAIVDMGSDPEQVVRAVNGGQLNFHFAGEYYASHRFPLRAVVEPGGVDFTIEGKPLMLRQSAQHAFRVQCHGVQKLGVMVCLFGVIMSHNSVVPPEYMEKISIASSIFVGGRVAILKLLVDLFAGVLVNTRDYSDDPAEREKCVAFRADLCRRGDVSVDAIKVTDPLGTVVVRPGSIVRMASRYAKIGIFQSCRVFDCHGGLQADEKREAWMDEPDRKKDYDWPEGSADLCRRHRLDPAAKAVDYIPDVESWNSKWTDDIRRWREKTA